MKTAIETLKFPCEFKKKLKMKASLGNLSIDLIDGHLIKIDKEYNVDITNTIFNKNEIENIGYMFRNNCFDIIINTKYRDVIISNYKNEEETTTYINTLRNFYNVKETEIEGVLFDINEFNSDEIIQIISQEKNKFEKNRLKILQIGA